MAPRSHGHGTCVEAAPRRVGDASTGQKADGAALMWSSAYEWASEAMSFSDAGAAPKTPSAPKPGPSTSMAEEALPILRRACERELPDAELLRFLRARGGKVRKAAAMLRTALAWHGERRTHEAGPWSLCGPDPRTGAPRVGGFQPNAPVEIFAEQHFHTHWSCRVGAQDPHRTLSSSDQVSAPL